MLLYAGWLKFIIHIPFLALFEKENYNVPVSYTHLDVYKRQASGNVLPYANVKNTGLFCVKDYCNHGHTGSYTLVTPKGKLYFAQLREMILLVS